MQKRVTAHTIATLLFCGDECNPPGRYSLDTLSSISGACFHGDVDCSLSNLIRFTALLDVSTYGIIYDSRPIDIAIGAPTSSLIDSTSLSNLGKSISLWGELEDVVVVVFLWRTIGDIRRGDTIRPRILGGVLGCALRLGGDSPELRNEFFFLIKSGSIVLGVFGTP